MKIAVAMSGGVDSSSEQQREGSDSPFSSTLIPRRWFHNCIVKPTSSWPCSFRIAAAADESTPPDMATAIFILGTHASGVLFALSTYDKLPVAIDHNRHARGVRTDMPKSFK